MSNPVAATGIVERAYFIENFRGFDFLLELGVNDQNERVLRQQIRETGTPVWRPLVEMLLEIDNYWKDADSKFPRSPRDNPPPPPHG